VTTYSYIYDILEVELEKEMKMKERVMTVRNEALLVRIRSIRIVEVDGQGSCTQVELLIAKKPKNPNVKPRFDIASFEIITRSTNGTGATRPRDNRYRRWEAN